ncbi:MAG TPA: TatD family deoxyribonuclease [Desulfomicrobiaceae bacterium]|nr:TatD family deoxyribonuclease [Desulfomicrobiaceae bacterium]
MSRKAPRPAPEAAALPPGGVDTHAHLDGDRYEDPLLVLERARACGVSAVGNVFLGPAAYAADHARFRVPGVFFLLGIHPYEADQATPDALAAMEAAFREDSRLRAVGEIGLDYHYDFHPRAVQQDALCRQLELALRLDVPVVIHSREAEDDTLAILERMGLTHRPVLWHCFGLGADWAAEIVRRGWILSIPGPVTFPKNHALRAAVAGLPPDSFVLETDCPYLAPEPYRGQRNEPALLVFTAREVARLRGEDPALVWRRCGATARRFFGIQEETGAEGGK